MKGGAVAMFGIKVGIGGAEFLRQLDMAVLIISTGTGKMTVELFSAEMLFKVCRYLN